MFLKALTLKGFKSFADATTLEFEPGVTVVVGPNGSGKSNIVDAVAWVLGAQSPSTLRSARMDDVIFAGNGRRSALGRAEVSLTIDNSGGLLPIEFTEVTLTRTLYRSSGESEYTVNSVPCRLLDIQELLSDSGVGRSQHVIVSQGHIDSVLNARPEDRRSVIEEAAGILKYRRRRQKAERRLEATEANVARLLDLLREVRRQLRPLERQAEAARRHGDLVVELDALRRHLAGRELVQLQARAEAGAAARHTLATEEASLRADLARLDTSVAGAEDALTRLGGGELGAVVGRFQATRERARGLAALVAERRRSIERERAVITDESLVAALEAESARVAEELVSVEQAAADLVPESERLSGIEGRLGDERIELEGRWAQALAVSGRQAAEVRGELSALRLSLERDVAERARVAGRLEALDQRRLGRLAESDGLRGSVEGLESSKPSLLSAVEAAESCRVAAEAGLASSRHRLAEAEGRLHSWQTRGEALAMALDEAADAGAVEVLRDLDGLVGTLRDLVTVDRGWEAAFEAACGEALTASVVAHTGAVRDAFDRLREAGAVGSVLPLGVLAPLGEAVPDGVGERVRHHVRCDRPDVDGLLDALLAGAVAVDGGWREALDVAVAHPAATVVTLAGDRLSPGGWRNGGSSSGASRAALLEAREQAGAAGEAVTAAATAVADAEAELLRATAALAGPSDALRDNDAALRSAVGSLTAVDAERLNLGAEVEAMRGHLTELGQRVGRQQERLVELETLLPALEEAEAAGAGQVAELRSARALLEERTGALATLQADLSVRAAGLEARRAELTRRLVDIDQRLSRYAVERAAAAGRRQHVELLLLRVARLGDLVEGRVTELDEALTGLRDRARKQSETAREAAAVLGGLRRERAGVERGLAETSERARRAELEDAESRLRLEAAVDNVRRELGCEPADAMAAECPELPVATSARSRVTELERELRIMGPVNPLALEEFTALSERSTFLDAQLGDVRASRRELGKVIRAIDLEIAQLFSAAYADVAENFSRLFETLFPGGQGRLRLTDPEHPLDTGIEVEARPSGKNVRKLSLLSGGERSLTAMAFLFAVFRSRPSPFYLLDEVEAALDDVNLHRFLDLVAEFRGEAQLLIVSHQKRTMEAADCLYGVTMAPGQSSRVLSERVAAAAG